MYRAVDSTGQTIDLLLTAKRDTAAAKRFFRKALAGPNNPQPRVINVDKNPAYVPAVTELKSEGVPRRRCCNGPRSLRPMCSRYFPASFSDFFQYWVTMLVRLLRGWDRIPDRIGKLGIPSRLEGKLNQEVQFAGPTRTSISDDDSWSGCERFGSSTLLTVLRLAVEIYGRGTGRPRFRTVLRRCA